MMRMLDSLNVSVMKSNFRAEYNDMPVFELRTGVFKRNDPYSMYRVPGGTHEVCSYAILRRDLSGKAYLTDYVGAAGVAWSGEPRKLLIAAFEASCG